VRSSSSKRRERCAEWPKLGNEFALLRDPKKLRKVQEISNVYRKKEQSQTKRRLHCKEKNDRSPGADKKIEKNVGKRGSRRLKREKKCSSDRRLRGTVWKGQGRTDHYTPRRHYRGTGRTAQPAGRI